MAPRKKKKADPNSFKVEVKEEKTTGIPVVNRFKIDHIKALSLWNQVLADHIRCGIGEFLSPLGFYPPVSSDECRTAGGFLINFTELFHEESIYKSLFSWLKTTMGSVLILWGVSSVSSAEWVKNEEDKRRLERFLVAWGYGLLKHPESDGKFPKYVEERMKTHNLEMW